MFVVAAFVAAFVVVSGWPGQRVVGCLRLGQRDVVASAARGVVPVLRSEGL